MEEDHTSDGDSDRPKRGCLVIRGNRRVLWHSKNKVLFSDAIGVLIKPCVLTVVGLVERITTAKIRTRVIWHSRRSEHDHVSIFKYFDIVTKERINIRRLRHPIDRRFRCSRHRVCRTPTHVALRFRQRRQLCDAHPVRPQFDRCEIRPRCEIRSDL